MNPALEQQLEYRRAVGGPFLSSWYPLLAPLRESLIDWMVESCGLGTDLVAVELPYADGVFFDAAGEAMARTARESIGLEGSFELLAAGRAEIDAPVLLMTHIAPLLALGTDRAAEQAMASGVDAVCVIDLPVDGDEDSLQALREAGLGIVYGVTARIDRRRLALLAARCEGLLWCQDEFDPAGDGVRSTTRDQRRLARKARSLVLADPSDVPSPRVCRRLTGILLRRLGAAALDAGAPPSDVVHDALRELRLEDR